MGVREIVVQSLVALLAASFLLSCGGGGNGDTFTTTGPTVTGHSACTRVDGRPIECRCRSASADCPQEWTCPWAGTAPSSCDFGVCGGCRAV